MLNTKIKKILNSFRGKLLFTVSLLLIITILLVSKFILQKESADFNPERYDDKTSQSIILPDIETLKHSLEGKVDSILTTFGLKKEWVTTVTSSSASDKTPKTQSKETEWFVKTVLIPKDLSSIEVNLDLSSFINSSGLYSSTYEDIITKDIVITVNNPDTLSKLPLAKIKITHSDKILRESGIICFILNGINEYTTEEIDRLIITKSEFSYVFPRNLDEIDIQNKLLHHKKDLIINLTIGSKDNYDTDFNTSLDEKAVRERVKSFSSDFPTITNIIFTKADKDVPSSFINYLAAEFAKYNIKSAGDSSITKLITKGEEETENKIHAIFAGLKNKTAATKNIVSVINVQPSEFEKFYDEVLVLKKLGYRFYNYSEYSLKLSEIEKERRQKEELVKKELEEKRKQVKQDNKKIVPKKPGKKQQEKKTTDKNSTDKKKTESQKIRNK